MSDAIRTCIGVIGTSDTENKAFLYMAGHFRKKGLPVPEIYACSDDAMCYLQQDLGDVMLFDLLKQARETQSYSPDEMLLLEKTMRMLAHVQIKGAEQFNTSYCYPIPEFNKRSILWDLNYFKYDFLKITGVEFLENELENEFEHMADLLLNSQPFAFMYRDFQSRNVMVYENEPYFIDFQGGRIGPLQYDVASFLWQAKAAYPSSLKEHLLEVYLDEVQELITIDREAFKKSMNFFVFFRTLQVLGAYGFRGYFEKKAHFLQSIPFALANLSELLPAIRSELPYLAQVLHNMLQLPGIQLPQQHDGLLVKVYSFSYKKGIPDDLTGNGGGFVFDCRAIHNPGRYEQYKQLTGRDEPVMTFLEKDGEILTFLDNVFALVDPSVERYIKRGFTDLMISFGCTGGQHRSVYAAQKTAEHIAEKYGIQVLLQHREQGIKQQFKAK